MKIQWRHRWCHSNDKDHTPPHGVKDSCTEGSPSRNPSDDRIHHTYPSEPSPSATLSASALLPSEAGPSSIRLPPELLSPLGN
jgi:hypothetical protein